MKKARPGNKPKLLIPEIKTLFVFNRNLKHRHLNDDEANAAPDKPENSSCADPKVFYT